MERMAPTHRRLAWAAGGSVAVAASAVVARRGVASWETSTFRTVNHLPDGLAPAVWVPMQLGALGAPLAIAAVLASTDNRRAAVQTAAAGVLAWSAAKAVKRVVDRERPGTHMSDTELRIGSADHGLGFPSGHAAVATIVGLSAGTYLGPSSALVALGVPTMVGLSRIYVGAHYPLDVVGGFGLGVAAWFVTELAVSEVAAIRRTE